MCAVRLYVLLSSTHRAFSEVDSPRVLVLFSNQPALPANQAILEGLEAELRAGSADPEQIFYEYLDAVRFDRPDVEEAMAAYFLVKYGQRPPKIVLTLGPQALVFATERRSDTFSTSGAGLRGGERRETATRPAAANARDPERVESGEIAGTGLTLQPDTKNIFVVTGASAFDKGWEKTAREKFESFATKHDVVYLAGLPFDELIDRVRHLPRHSTIVYLSMFEDGKGQQFLPRDVAGRIAATANAPVYGVYDTYVGSGIVGGYMDTFKAVGQQLGVLANRLLKGEDPGSISPYEAETHRYIVDWRQLDRWGLAKSALPAGTELRFKPASVWELYKSEILLAIALILLQSAVLVKSLLEDQKAEASGSECTAERGADGRGCFRRKSRPVELERSRQCGLGDRALSADVGPAAGWTSHTRNFFAAFLTGRPTIRCRSHERCHAVGRGERSRI